MKKLNKTSDTKKYLKFGDLTQPFIPTDELRQDIIQRVEKNSKNKNLYTPMYAILDFIHQKVKPMDDALLKCKLKFNRTAKEIWQSGFATGCTDYALLFCTFARQLGYPTTILLTVGQGFYNHAKHSQPEKYTGHTFCECFCDFGLPTIQEKWVLIDPTTCKGTIDYLANSEIKLNYQVGNEKVFLPYFRGLDLQKRQTLKEFNNKIDEFVKNC